jgi:hypothetical protein
LNKLNEECKNIYIALRREKDGTGKPGQVAPTKKDIG